MCIGPIRLYLQTLLIGLMVCGSAADAQAGRRVERGPDGQDITTRGEGSEYPLLLSRREFWVHVQLGDWRAAQCLGTVFDSAEEEPLREELCPSVVVRYHLRSNPKAERRVGVVVDGLGEFHELGGFRLGPDTDVSSSELGASQVSFRFGNHGLLENAGDCVLLEITSRPRSTATIPVCLAP